MFKKTANMHSKIYSKSVVKCIYPLYQKDKNGYMHWERQSITFTMYVLQSKFACTHILM